MTAHETTIDGTTATCLCGWTYTSADLGTLQAAALAHEYDGPQYEAAGIDPRDTVTDDLTADTATPPPTSDGGALPTERMLNAEGTESRKTEHTDAEIVAGKLASVASRINRKRAEADALMEERDRHVFALRAAGWSYRKIAELAGMAHQRVEQIVTGQ